MIRLFILNASCRFRYTNFRLLLPIRACGAHKVRSHLSVRFRSAPCCCCCCGPRCIRYVRTVGFKLVVTAAVRSLHQEPQHQSAIAFHFLLPPFLPLFRSSSPANKTTPPPPGRRTKKKQRKNPAKLTRQKLLKAQRHEPIPIIIIPLKHIRHPLQTDTALHEQIETHRALAALVVGAEQQRDEGGGERVAESDEGVAELLHGNGAAAVGVEAVEEGAPGGEEGPEVAVCFWLHALAGFAFWPFASFVKDEKKGRGGKKDEGRGGGDEYRNSAYAIVPDRSVSNIRIIMRTVYGSKLVKSPLTRALPSSRSVSWPWPSMSTAWKSANSEASSSMPRPPVGPGAGVGGGREDGGGRLCGSVGRGPKP